MQPAPDYTVAFTRLKARFDAAVETIHHFDPTARVPVFKVPSDPAKLLPMLPLTFRNELTKCAAIVREVETRAQQLATAEQEREAGEAAAAEEKRLASLSPAERSLKEMAARIAHLEMLVHAYGTRLAALEAGRVRTSTSSESAHDAAQARKANAPMMTSVRQPGQARHALPTTKLGRSPGHEPAPAMGDSAKTFGQGGRVGPDAFRR